jgi:hypothetical protein
MVFGNYGNRDTSESTLPGLSYPPYDLIVIRSSQHPLFLVLVQTRPCNNLSQETRACTTRGISSYIRRNDFYSNEYV